MNNHYQTNKQRISWKKLIALFKDYFIHSDEKLIAWLLLSGTILCVIGLVALLFAFNWWAAAFWAVLMAKEVIPFLQSMAVFTLIVCSYAGVYSLKNYLEGKLSIRWRDWLTHKILHELFYGENNYLDLKRFSAEIDNIAQRIQEDVKTFVNLTLTLGTDFLKSILSLGAFVSTLWIVGGALSVVLLGLNIIVPGYLVWVALIAALAATATTHFIGKSLAENHNKAERMEADFRQSLGVLNDDAENIAEEHAEDYYKISLEKKLQRINATAHNKLNTQTKLVAFQNFYAELAGILPYILATPLYFAGAIEIGALMQIGMSFTQVNSSLSWFVETYESLASYKTSIERIAEMQKTFEKEGLAAHKKAVLLKERDKDSIHIKHLTIQYPHASMTSPIMRNLSLKLKPGEHVLLKGPSGLGKSTLFKVISGTWKYGEGTISLPSKKSIYFLPQEPTLPHDTLMAVLAYPEPVSKYTKEQYINALEVVGMESFGMKLEETRQWSNELSGGQQQRISFARVILKKPDWIFLDEATSSLDEENEEQVYRIAKELKDTTLVSIAHRSTVAKFHSKILFFNANAEKEVQVKEQEINLASFYS